MKREPAWRRYLRFWGSDAGSDVEDELQFHLQMKEEELIAAGWAPRQAHREALRQFGPVRPVRGECRRISQGREAEVSRIEYFAGWLQDLRYAVRTLCRTKVSTVTAMSILALGTGATTSVFLLLDRLLYRPLPVPHPSQLLFVSDSTPSKGGSHEWLHHESFSYQAYDYLRDHNQTFAGLAAEASVQLNERRESGRIERPARAAVVSGNYFEVLGTAPLLGRTLAAADERSTAESRVAVMSYRFWTRRFSQSPAVLGQTVYLNDAPFTIVGVLPGEFYGLHKRYESDLYVPLASLPGLFDLRGFRDDRWIQVFGRLAPHVAAATAAANLQTLLDQFAGGPQPAVAGARIEYQDGSLGTPGAGDQERRSLLLLGAIVALLLAMGCANVACLLLARGAVRQQEIAVRLSLGAGTARLLRQSLLESGLLALAGGTVGLAVSYGAGRLLLAAFQWQNRPIELTPDWRVLAFGLAVSLVTGLLCGVAPAAQVLRSSRVALTPERTVAPRFTSLKVLVTGEVALALVLVAGAAVFIRSFQNLRSVPAGFSTDRVSVVTLSSDANPGQLKAPFAEALVLAEALRRAPRVEAAAISDLLTFDDGRIGYPIGTPGGSPRNANLLKVDGNYFAALRIPLLTGRAFTARDDENAPRVVILSEGTARRLFPGENPLGQTMLLGNVTHPKPENQVQVVGIVNDIKFTALTAPAPDVVFQPLAQGQHDSATTSTLKLQVRGSLKPHEVAALTRALIAESHLPVTVDSAAPLEDAIASSMREDRLRMQASSLFGILALLLITAGTYGLMAYSVAMRTREIGIRMVVGSRPSEIVGLVLRQSLRLILAGAMLGLPAALLAMKAVSRMLFGLSPMDWASIAIAVLLLSVTGVLASVVPAWRAAHLDPLSALRVQ